MASTFFRDKYRIFQAPLTDLSPRERLIVKTFLFFFGGLIRIEQEENFLCTSDPLIFAFNHNCSFETFFTAIYLIYQRSGKKISFISDWIYGRVPVIGWFYKHLDPIYVYNKKSTLAAINRRKDRPPAQSTWLQCLEHLKNRRSLGFFPEGTRNRHPYELLRGRKGIGEVALLSGVPVQPIGIDFPARRYSGKIPKFGSLILRVGRLMSFPQERKVVLAMSQDEQVMPALRKKVMGFCTARVTHTVMTELSKLSGKRYPFSPPAMPPYVQPFFETKK